MASLRESVRDFLASERIAVAGVSRDPRQISNAIYRKLKGAGYSVIALNPKTDRVEGDACYPSLREVPGGVQAVVIATPPEATLDVARECIATGVRHVWMHRSFGQGSVSEEAARLCRENGIRVIAGACPMMYVAPVDFAHACMRTVLGWVGRLPSGA